MKAIMNEFDKIKKNDYNENMDMVTGDSLEDIFNIVKEYKSSVRKDFVGFKGMTDEMNTFSNAAVTKYF